VSAHLGERLSALLDGELSPHDHAQAQVHLRECAACAQALEELAAVDAMAREVPVEAPPGYFDALPGRIRTRVRERRKPRVAPAAVWAAAAAAVVMVAVVTPRMLRQRPSPMPASLRTDELQRGRAAVPEAAPPAVPAPTVPPPAKSADKTITSSLTFSDKGEADAPAANRDRLARAPAPASPATPSAPEEAKMRLRREETELAAAAPPRAKTAPVPPAPAPAVATPSSGYASEPAAPAPQTAQAPSTRGAVASIQEQKADGETTRDTVGGAAGAPDAADARKERYQGRRLRPEERYEGLTLRRPSTAAEARDLARAWESFARDLPGDRHADEARVRAVEAAATAWRLGHGAEDLAQARAAARSYLGDAAARQGDRVRALLESLPPEP
jgi:hypothetical protein